MEEQDRQRLTIAQKETGEPPLGVDLDAGTARLPSPELPGEDAPATTDAPEPPSP